MIIFFLMNCVVFLLFVVVLFVSVVVFVGVQQIQLLLQQKCIIDEVIYVDYGVYEVIQGWIQVFNDGGCLICDYYLFKVQCWLDVLFYEYSCNDCSVFLQQVFIELEKLIVGMEQGVLLLFIDILLVNKVKYLCDDLWQCLWVLYGVLGFSCVQQQVVCGEVELVYVGNEFNQQQWWYFKLYIQIVEELVNEVEVLVCQCGVVLVIVVVLGLLVVNVLFEFDCDVYCDICIYFLESVDCVLVWIVDEGL